MRRADERAVSTVVEKMLSLGLVTLYLGLVSVTIYGGILPDFRTAAGDELADRALAKATERIQQSVPPNATAVDSRSRVTLPKTIRGSNYEIRVDGRTLILDHPQDRIDERARLALPETVTRVEGRWHSGKQTYIDVDRSNGGLIVSLTSEDHP